MFKKEFQKEMSRIKPDQRLVNRTKHAIHADVTPKERKRHVFRPIVAFATTAAVACLVIFGALPNFGGDELPGQISNNSFTLQAFAMEQQDGTFLTGSELEIADGRIAVEFDNSLESSHLGAQGIFANDDFMGGDLLGLVISTGLGFRLDGENIASATLTADQGFFQVIRTDNRVYWYIDRIDGTFELNDANLSSMLIWGYEYKYDVPIPVVTRGETTTIRAVTEQSEPNPHDRLTNTANKLPESVVFTAVVTFEDGEEQVKSITFNPRDVWEAVGIQIENMPPPTQNPDGTWG